MVLNKKIRTFIDESILCWLATVDKHGQPNVSPKEIFTYYKDTSVIVANIASPSTTRNIKFNNKVCISFINVLTQKGYKLNGEGYIIEKNDMLYADFLSPLERMTEGLFPINNIIRIIIKEANPIIAPKYMFYPATTEQQQIDSAKKQYLLIS